MSKPIIAIMYDFDKTLSTTDMQNYGFIPSLGLTSEEFWGETEKLSSSKAMDRILSYMYMMVYQAKQKGIKLTKEYLNECGKNIIYNPGVDTWFKRINDYAESKGFQIEHYLVSSGTLEIFQGTSIAKEFTRAYGCEFVFDSNGEAIWPKRAINYTQKTQYFFRIAKGVTDETDDKRINEKQESLRIPFGNIIYIGDGLTDIACMTVVKQNKGTSIAVFPENHNEFASKIKCEGRVNYAVQADYTKGSAIENAVKLTIDKIKMAYDINAFEENN